MFASFPVQMISRKIRMKRW